MKKDLCELAGGVLLYTAGLVVGLFVIPLDIHPLLFVVIIIGLTVPGWLVLGRGK